MMGFSAAAEPMLAKLREQERVVWLREPNSQPSDAPNVAILEEIADARARLARFRPALAKLFAESHWDGRVNSPLIDYPDPPAGLDALLVKCDHALPMTGSIKARGGVYELLCRLEEIAIAEGMVSVDSDYGLLATAAARVRFARHCIAVSSTGNLGFSIGLVARAFGAAAQVHMSRDAKSWKKERLRRIGAEVIEHDCDFNGAVVCGREAARASGALFIDDTSSRELLLGYAVAADELIAQLDARRIAPTRERPLVVYLPCGVGGAPGGVTLGLKERLGDAVVAVFVEPAASACMMVALLAGGREARPVYGAGLDNNTVADGLAVATASQVVLDLAGDRIDAVVALPDADMLQWVPRAWSSVRMRLEPSAAASLAAVAPFVDARPDLAAACHISWTTGGSLLPDEEFLPLLSASSV